jgi:hypothetical protein
MRAAVKGNRLFLAVLFSALVAFSYAAQADSKKNADKSDLNEDGVVDIVDLHLFSFNYLELDAAQVEWCDFYSATKAGEPFNDKSTKYYARNFRMLLAFIYEYFECGVVEPPPPPADPPQPEGIVRIAAANDGSGDYYVTDGTGDAVFIYGADLQPRAEIGGLDRPLGVAVDDLGYVLIGNNGRDNIEVFDPQTGDLYDIFGGGRVKMPTAITVATDGSVYVTDSRSHRVWVYDAYHKPVRAIGSGGQGPQDLDFPTDTALLTYPDGETEVFVADQGNARVQVYTTEGEWLRSIEFEGTPGEGCGMLGCTVPGMQPFTRPQALEVDSQGRLHVLDNALAAVVVFDPSTGEYLGHYGEYGEGDGFLRVPLDFVINTAGQAVVNAGDGARIEVLEILQ